MLCFIRKNRCARWLSTIGERVGVGRTHKDYSVLRPPSIDDHTGFVFSSPAVSDLVVGSINAFAERAGVKPETTTGYWFVDSLKERSVRESKDDGDEQPQWRTYCG